MQEITIFQKITRFSNLLSRKKNSNLCKFVYSSPQFFLHFRNTVTKTIDRRSFTITLSIAKIFFFLIYTLFLEK